MKGVFSSRFAANISVTDAAGTQTAKAFISPVSVKNPEGNVMGVAGEKDGRRWNIILEPIPLSGTVTVTWDGRQFALVRAEMIGGDHIEGLLRLKAGGTGAQ